MSWESERVSRFSSVYHSQSSLRMKELLSCAHACVGTRRGTTPKLYDSVIEASILTTYVIAMLLCDGVYRCFNTVYDVDFRHWMQFYILSLRVVWQKKRCSLQPIITINSLEIGNTLQYDWFEPVKYITSNLSHTV